ncbi:hypothetical protein [Oceanibaculum nanhaiense]|uniref:hypothetical protein n=1 Tax=Oceanibaculum nanhaiense TaxID=1909734 RepID=UPI000A3980D8|nr:hypothetical protein [Oceanibaculum nanhaiense]|tara:strand:+ start:420 stop:701 length:282 start_codon:yes stop_codon:yes gene_type:complete
MANNLHISYDLHSPGQNYDDVTDAIKSLGKWAKIHESFWYVKSKKSASEACDIVWAACDENDTVYVVDATNNNAAWQNLPDNVSNFIMEKWHQ